MESAGSTGPLFFFPEAAIEFANTLAYTVILVIVTIAGFVDNNQ